MASLRQIAYCLLEAQVVISPTPNLGYVTNRRQACVKGRAFTHHSVCEEPKCDETVLKNKISSHSRYIFCIQSVAAFLYVPCFTIPSLYFTGMISVTVTLLIYLSFLFDLYFSGSSHPSVCHLSLVLSPLHEPLSQ